MGRKKCPHVETMNKTHCAGQLSPVCPVVLDAPAAEAAGRRGSAAVADPHCAVTDWSDWSPCSVSCGEFGPRVKSFTDPKDEFLQHVADSLRRYYSAPEESITLQLFPFDPPIRHMR